MSLISERLETVIATRPDWYNDSEFIELYTKYFPEDNEIEVNDQWGEEAWQISAWFGVALREGRVMLSLADDGYNDDDRALEYGGPTASEVDTIIVHHTDGSEDLTLAELSAIHLLRLYLPLFMKIPNPFINFLAKMHPDLATKPLAPASGHYVERNGEKVQDFSGYHVLIYADGRVEFPLGLHGFNYLLFHAGNYPVNARSIGIAFVGNYREKGPTEQAKQSFKDVLKLIEEWGIQIKHLDTHKHVRLTSPTDCPGDWFDTFSEEFPDLTPVSLQA